MIGSRKSGRNSAYVEYEDALWASEVWTKPTSIDELEERLKKRNYSVRDVFLHECLVKRSERLLTVLANKVLPDKIDVTSAGMPVRVLEIGKKEKPL